MNYKKTSRKPAFRLSTPVRLGVAAVAACFIAAPVLSCTVNSGVAVVNGTACFDQAGKVLTITNSNGAILNWDRFSIKAGETTHFAQTSASSSVLNRVLNDPSAIYGTLSSNGRVWLINPAGIMVGAGGRIDTAAFVASTLSIRNEDFLAGRHLFINDGGAKNIDIEKTAQITTPAGGSVYLIGSNVTNEGIITTPKGETILAAGATVSLIDSATPGVKVDITGAAGNATNLGEITAEAGRIGIAGVIVRNSGTLNASSVVNEGGRIFLKASQDAYVDGNGRIVTTGTKGGSVEVLGNRVAVMDNASIDASATSEGGDGGKILVGGDYQGKNPDIQNASITYFGPNASLKADAGKVGDGGTVIVWADDTTRAYGTISARGGASGGNGGFVETSGHRYLDVQGIKVGAGATAGSAGMWLLDPNDVTIVHGTNALDSNIVGSPNFVPASDASNSVVSDATLNSAIGGGTSVTVATASTGSAGNGDIFLDGTASGGVVLSKNAGDTWSTTLALNAWRDIRIKGPVTFQTAGAGTGSLYVNFNPDTGVVGGKVKTDSGALLTTATGSASSTVGIGIANAKTWDHSGTLNLAGHSYVDLNISGAGAFNNLAGGVVNITSSHDFTFQSDNVSQNGLLNNFGTINASGTFGAGEDSWEVQYSQMAGGTLNIGAGKTLSMQNADVIYGGVTFGSGGVLRLSETHAGARSFSGATISGAGWVDVYSQPTSFTTTTLGGGAAIVNSAGLLSVPSGVTFSGSGGFMASGGLTLNAGTTLGSSGSITLAAGWDGASPLSAPLTPNAGNILIIDAIVNGSAVNLYAGGNISLNAVTGPVSVSAGSGGMNVKAVGALAISGGPVAGASAYLGSAGTQTVYAGTIAITAGGSYGTFAMLSASGDQQINTTIGGISLTGGAPGGSSTSYGSWAGINHGGTGNQTINIYGGTLSIQGGGGQGTTTPQSGFLPSAIWATCGTGSPDPACGIATTANYASIHSQAGNQTISFQNAGSALTLTGGSGGIRNFASISNSGAGTQAVYGSPTITLTGGVDGGNGTKSNDGYRYLQNNATLFSPSGAQYLTATSIALSSTATAASGWAGAWITGNGQNILMSGALSLAAGDTSYGGGAVGIRSLAGQTISAGAVTLVAGDLGYDNTASIDQVGTGAYSQSLTATSLTLQGGIGNGAGNNAGDCGAACNGLASHNSAGVYNSGSGGQTVNVAGGAISLIAGTVGNGNKAYIQNRSASLQTINAGSIYMQGGDSGGLNSVWMFGQGTVFGGSWLANNASITSGWSGGLIGSQNISTGAGAITIKGNSGAGTGGMAGAGIGATGTQSISGGAIALTGGAGAGSSDSSARIGSLGQQTINATTLVVQGGATGVGNRASVTGYGQTINLAGGVLTVYGGGSLGSGHGNTAEIMNFGGSGQSINFSAAATMIVHGGAGSGYAPYGGNECGALCNNLSSWNSAQVRNESGNQTISFVAGSSLLVTGGSNGNDNSANIQNRTTGTQSILGNPTITLARGASGGTAVWGQQQVASSEHPVGAWRWFELTNDAGIDSDGAQIINASVVTLDSRNATGTAYGGTYISGRTQTITATGAVTLWGGNEGINTPIGAATEFLFVAPAVIGYDGAGHSVTIDAASVMLNGAAGAGWGAYGGSPALIGTYKHATDVTITTTGGGGIVLNATTQPSALLGSFFGDGGQITLDAGTAGPITLTGSEIGTGSSGSTTLIGSTVTQTVDGLVYTPLLDITTNNGAVSMAGLNQASTVNLDTGTGAVSYLSGQSVGLYLAATTTGTLNVTATDLVSGGDISVYKSGDMALAAGKSFTSTYGGDIFVAATNNMTYSGATFTNAYSGSYGGVGLAANNLDISSALAPNGGNSDIILAGANVNINAGVTGLDIGLVAGSLNTSNTGWLLANNSLLAVVAGDVHIDGGYIKTSAGDVEMIVGGDLNIGNASYGGYIWAGFGQSVPSYTPDASIAVGGDINLNNGGHIKAANDVYLDLLGSTSKLVLNDGTVGYAPSYILSDIGTGVIGTTHVAFLGRSSGGVVINGIETTTTVVGGSGFFAVNSSTPATVGAGLQITYSVNQGQDLCALSPDLCNPKPPTDNPIDEPPPSFEITGPGGTKPGGTPGQTAGGTEGSFGGEENGPDDKKDDKKDDKDKKSDQAKDGKKDDKPGQKKVAQCS